MPEGQCAECHAEIGAAESQGAAERQLPSRACFACACPLPDSACLLAREGGMDGVHFSPRMDEDRQCMLVIIGADEWGNKDVLV